MKKIIQWILVSSVMSLSYNHAYNSDVWYCEADGDMEACHRFYGMYCYDNGPCYWMYDNAPVL